MNLLDRSLVRGYLKSYFVCLTSLLSLYVIVDLFMNLDDFADRHRGLSGVLQHIATYYGYRISQIFDRLSEAIVLLAAMFTVAWMQRNNEMLPLLSAGVSTRRVIRPIILCAVVLLGLSVVNQELIIPQIAPMLLADRDDPKADRALLVHGAFEPNLIHVSGDVAQRRQKMVKDFSCLIPESIARNSINIAAREAYYYEPGEGPCGGGGWLLTDADPKELEGWNLPAILEVLDSGKYFLHTKEVDFDALTRPRTWFIYASTPRLLEELNKPDSTRLASMAVVFHMRLTRPILGLLLVVMGLALILRDQNRNIFVSTALCLIQCGIFFGACLTCKQMGDREYLSPALAAWLPVLVFGPLAIVRLDAVHT
jgi:lipopolysaccharide export system permease protein